MFHLFFYILFFFLRQGACVFARLVLFVSRIMQNSLAEGRGMSQERTYSILLRISLKGQSQELFYIHHFSLAFLFSVSDLNYMSDYFLWVCADLVLVLSSYLYSNSSILSVFMHIHISQEDTENAWACIQHHWMVLMSGNHCVLHLMTPVCHFVCQICLFCCDCQILCWSSFFNHFNKTCSPKTPPTSPKAIGPMKVTCLCCVLFYCISFCF